MEDKTIFVKNYSNSINSGFAENFFGKLAYILTSLQPSPTGYKIKIFVLKLRFADR